MTGVQTCALPIYKTLSDRYARHDFDIVIELLQWMNYDPNLMLNDLYDFDKEAVYLLSI